jgi:dienelactone hydrolase
MNRTNMIPVTFDSEGCVLSGNLFLPPEYTQGTRLPGIAVTGSWTTVKEQMAGLYARRLAQKGFVTLAFDFRHWGGGEPRQWESPERKIRDITNAAAFLQTRSEVASDGVGALAICASAGYLAHAVARGAPVRSIALVASWLHDAATVSPIYGGESGITRRLEAARAAREQFEHAGTTPYAPAYDPEDPAAAMFFPLDYYAQRDRGAVPEWTNRFAVMS